MANHFHLEYQGKARSHVFALRHGDYLQKKLSSTDPTERQSATTPAQVLYDTIQIHEEAKTSLRYVRSLQSRSPCALTHDDKEMIALKILAIETLLHDYLLNSVGAFSLAPEVYVFQSRAEIKDGKVVSQEQTAGAVPQNQTLRETLAEFADVPKQDPAYRRGQDLALEGLCIKPNPALWRAYGIIARQTNPYPPDSAHTERVYSNRLMADAAHMCGDLGVAVNFLVDSMSCVADALDKAMPVKNTLPKKDKLPKSFDKNLIIDSHVLLATMVQTGMLPQSAYPMPTFDDTNLHTSFFSNDHLLSVQKKLSERILHLKEGEEPVKSIATVAEQLTRLYGYKHKT